jgi:hypothetical protein
LPEYLPSIHDNELLDLDFSKNNITEFNTKYYLNLTIALNIDDNIYLHKVDPKSFPYSRAMRKLSIRNNKRLKEISETLQLLDPCQVSFGDLYLSCNCELLWIAEWANSPKSSNCPGNNNIYCFTEDGKTLLSSMWTKDNLKCLNTNYATIVVAIAFGISSLLIATTVLMTYYYRYEIYLLTIRKSKKGTLGNECFKFDIYVSFNENDSDLFSWVITILEPELNASGYSICLPCRDFPPGGVKADAIFEYLPQCKKFLFLVDENFLSSRDVSTW